MKRYITDSARRLEESTVKVLPAPISPEMQLVKAYPDIKYQAFLGFGAALTEAAGHTFAQMDEATQEHFLNLCFSEEHNRYSLCRLSIQSCDFSLVPRSYMDAPSETLEGFSIDDDWAYVLPLVKAAQRINPRLEFLASPWSPPAWAKTTRTMKLGGHLRPGMQDQWARMIARMIADYRTAGVNIGRITVQNEPQAAQTWESCLYSTSQEMTFLHEHLKPALRAEGLDHVKTFIWDHNKDRVLDRATEALADPKAALDVDGIAFHWYAGDHFEALRATRDVIGPDRELILSEGCDFYTAGDEWWELSHAEHYAREIIGDFEAGANAILDWNILLNAQGGPNHVGNYCDAPIMFDEESGSLNVRLPFYYLGHFSHFLRIGARRMLVTRYTSWIETCGFVNPDGQRVLFVLNRRDEDCDFDLTWGSGAVGRRIAHLDAPAHSIQTICW